MAQPNEKMVEDLTPSQEDKLLNGINDDIKTEEIEPKKLAFDPSKPIVLNDAIGPNIKTKNQKPILMEAKLNTSAIVDMPRVNKANEGKQQQAVDAIVIGREKVTLSIGDIVDIKPNGTETGKHSANNINIVTNDNQTPSFSGASQIKPGAATPSAANTSTAKGNKKSGAQRRKAKQNRTEHFMQNRGHMSASPLTSTPISNKRGRSTPGSTGMDQPMKKTNTNKSTDNYAEALSKANLIVGVVDFAEGNVVKMIEDSQYFKFLEAMNEKHFECISSGGYNGNIPSFTENRNMRSAVKIRCSDSASRRWLEALVPTLSNESLWEGANLAVIDFDAMPKPETVNIWFPGTKRSNADILNILQTCNPGLTSANWSVIRRKTSEKGTSLKLGIGEQAKKFITGKRNRLFFGIVQAVCYFQKGKDKKKKEILQEMDIDASLLVTDTEAETDDANSEMSETIVEKKKPTTN